MNIFEALCKGKGRINEENTSSFLAYLLNPTESHGIRYVFITEFFKLIENKIKDQKKNGGTSFKNENITSYVDDADIQIELEKFFSDDGDSKRVMDIIVDSDDFPFVFGIENKICTGSAQKTQLKEEYEQMKSYYKGQNQKNKKTIIMVFLPPLLIGNKKDPLSKEYEELTVDNTDCKISVCWFEIINVIRSILRKEVEAQIPPITDYVKHTLKAFVCYLEKLNQVIKREITVEYEATGETYKFIQLSNGQIRIDTDDREGLIPKDMAFDILHEIGLKEYKTYDPYKGTTQMFGERVFKEIKGKSIKITDKKTRFSSKNRRLGSNQF